jgi:hypothetical protein
MIARAMRTARTVSSASGGDDRKLKLIAGSRRALSLQALAKRDGITPRYIRRLVGLAFLSLELVEAIVQGWRPVELTATRLTELDLPLDWTEQRRLLAS